MTPFKLTVPEPCHENWSKMSPKEKGRHCTVCDKTVVDFTQKSVEEISKIVLSSTAKVCGRFNTYDLNKIHVPQHVYTPTLKIKPKWFTLLTVFAFLGFAKKASAYTVPVVADKEPIKPDNLNIKKGQTIIKGFVKHSDTKKGIAQVEIKVYSAGKEIAFTKSFANGSYFLTLPENSVFDFTMDVEYNKINFASEVLKNLPVQKKEITINPVMSPQKNVPVPTVPFLKIEPDPGVVAYEEVSKDSVAELPETEIELPSIDIENDRPYVTMGVYATQRTYYINPRAFSEEISLDDNSGVASDDNIFLSLYPNPTANIVIIDIKNTVNATLQLFDFQGKIIRNVNTNEKKNMMDLSELPDGTYIVRVLDHQTNKATSKQVVKLY